MGVRGHAKTWESAKSAGGEGYHFEQVLHCYQCWAPFFKKIIGYRY